MSNTCPTCGRQIGSCRHTEEQAPNPTCPQAAMPVYPSPGDVVAAGGVDAAACSLQRALRMLVDGADDRGFHYSSLADRVSYATASIRNALASLERP